MAIVTYPLNNVEFSAEDAELFHVTRTSGVYAENSFDYSVNGADNNIVVGTGIGWIKNSEFSGKVIAQKEPISINLGLPDSVYPRIDAIVIRFDANKNETEIVSKSGVASSSPVAPEVVRTESVYELHLFHVLRSAGALYVTPDAVTDLRKNSTYCGLMADSITKVGDDTNKVEMDLLWENASPTSSFTAQTISVNILGYDAILVDFNVAADHSLSSAYFADRNRVEKSIITENGVLRATHARYTSDAVYVVMRDFKPYFDTNTIAFELGYQNGVEKPRMMIPYKIYGIKGVQA